MTDKEIIIDGVDVSECRYLFDDTSYKRSKTSCSITLKDCKYLGDKCYFKQLKRKERECEELEEQLELNTANAVVIDMAQRLYKLKQTLTEIKDYCNKYQQNSIGFKKYILQKISECEAENEYRAKRTINGKN